MHNYVISDIHGNSERFKHLLKILKERHPNGDFVLHIIGDIFDRGKTSAEVYNLIVENDKNINFLLGNHEMLFMDFMENPKDAYVFWQANYAYVTIKSFLDEFLIGLLKSDVVFDNKGLNKLYNESYNIVKNSLKKLFGNNKENNVQVYIDELKNTNSERDLRKVSTYIRQFIAKECPHLTIKNRALVENTAYLILLDQFCMIYKQFSLLKPCAVVDDKFLLVHSGFVSRNNDKFILDNVQDDFYRSCKSRNDLLFQDIYPMLWSRRTNTRTGTRQAPDERFDNLIIIFGHTIVNVFRENNSLDPLFTFDKNGKLASIGIDGRNFDMSNGQLNCVCLDDLSFILISGSNEAHKEDPTIKKITVKNIVPQELSNSQNVKI